MFLAKLGDALSFLFVRGETNLLIHIKKTQKERGNMNSVILQASIFVGKSCGGIAN